jgi:hypothetical protein
MLRDFPVFLRTCGWEADLDAGAAERRFVDVDRTAIELRQLAHDRQADALPADALVEAGAAVEHARALVDGNSGPSSSTIRRRPSRRAWDR